MVSLREKNEAIISPRGLLLTIHLQWFIARRSF